MTTGFHDFGPRARFRRLSSRFGDCSLAAERLRPAVGFSDWLRPVGLRDRTLLRPLAFLALLGPGLLGKRTWASEEESSELDADSLSQSSGRR